MSVSACYQNACGCHSYYSIPPTILCGLTRALVSSLRYFNSRHFRYLRVGQCHSFFHRKNRKPKRMHSLILVHLQVLFASETYHHLCYHHQQPNEATVIIGWFLQTCDTYCHNNRQAMLVAISNAKTKSSTMASSPSSRWTLCTLHHQYLFSLHVIQSLLDKCTWTWLDTTQTPICALDWICCDLEKTILKSGNFNLVRCQPQPFVPPCHHMVFVVSMEATEIVIETTLSLLCRGNGGNCCQISTIKN